MQVFKNKGNVIEFSQLTLVHPFQKKKNKMQTKQQQMYKNENGRKKTNKQYTGFKTNRIYFVVKTK